MNKKTSKVRFLALSAVIAALYAVLTYAAAAMNLAFGAVQFRFSEALTVLPAFTPAAIPGLAVGCLISNLASPLGVVDWVFGTLATLLAGIFSYLVRNIRWKEIPVLAPLPPVIFKADDDGVENDRRPFSTPSSSALKWLALRITARLLSAISPLQASSRVPFRSASASSSSAMCSACR